MRQEIAGLVQSGKGRDQILAYYIEKYGSQEPLAEPIDSGFNRLAWLVPYVAGGAGAVVVGLMASRWSKRHSGPDRDDSADAGASDSRLERKLDDELRDLD
jgi:cytochrome c-type biogenesis protein CcmH/NrfF